MHCRRTRGFSALLSRTLGTAWVAGIPNRLKIPGDFQLESRTKGRRFEFGRRWADGNTELAHSVFNHGHNGEKMWMQSRLHLSSSAIEIRLWLNIACEKEKRLPPQSPEPVNERSTPGRSASPTDCLIVVQAYYSSSNISSTHSLDALGGSTLNRWAGLGNSSDKLLCLGL